MNRARQLDCTVATTVDVHLHTLISALLAPALSASAAPVFELAATHPDAAIGKSIQTLKPFHGKLYAGYGDYFTNTGPIADRAFEPATGTFGSSLLSAQTEALMIYREIGGKLYALHIDPWPSPRRPRENSAAIRWASRAARRTSGATIAWCPAYTCSTSRPSMAVTFGSPGRAAGRARGGCCRGRVGRDAGADSGGVAMHRRRESHPLPVQRVSVGNCLLRVGHVPPSRC